MSRPTLPIGELLDGAAGSQTTCPKCGRGHAFYATNSYQTKTAGRRRLRQCRFCKHANSETVPPAVPDEDHEEHKV